VTWHLYAASGWLGYYPCSKLNVLELLAEFGATTTGHLRCLEGLLLSVWPVLHAADTGAPPLTLGDPCSTCLTPLTPLMTPDDIERVVVDMGPV
jgi:hypothetical protein